MGNSNDGNMVMWFDSTKLHKLLRYQMISLIQCEYIDDKKNTKTLTNDLSAKAKTKFPAEYIYYAFIHRYTGTSHLNAFDPKHNIIRVIQLYITNINTTLMKNIQ